MSPAAAANPRARRVALALAALGAGLALAACGTARPRPISASELAEAQTFPYFRVYWVGPRFEGHHLAAVDGLKTYNVQVGDSVYYGDCVQGKGIFGGGSCLLPAQVTTVVYVLHSNSTLGPQTNLLLRGVPAVVYDEGRAIELYTGRVAIDIFSDTYAHALAAAELLRPVNAPGSASADLPPPVFCPDLWGSVAAPLARVLASLPGHVCQSTDAEEAYITKVDGHPRLGT